MRRAHSPTCATSARRWRAAAPSWSAARASRRAGPCCCRAPGARDCACRPTPKSSCSRFPEDLHNLHLLQNLDHACKWPSHWCDCRSCRSASASRCSRWCSAPRRCSSLKVASTPRSPRRSGPSGSCSTRGSVRRGPGGGPARPEDVARGGRGPRARRANPRGGGGAGGRRRPAPRDGGGPLPRRYAWFAGPFTPPDVQPLRSLRGVHLEPVLRRFYPSADFARAVIGRVGDDGRGGGSGGGGLERLLDSLLAGTPGSAVVLKDREGREYESPARVIAEPIAGSDVVLTLDAELQEIAQRALDDAIENMEADGGDVVMLDPRAWEILAC